MATKENLIGLGVPAILADRIGTNPSFVTAYGASPASANPIGGSQFITVVMTGTSSLRVPQIGGNDGALVGDEFWVVNLTAASIKVYALSTYLGSAVTFYQKGTSVVGATGMSVEAGGSVILKPVTMSTWVGVAGASV